MRYYGYAISLQLMSVTQCPSYLLLVSVVEGMLGELVTQRGDGHLAHLSDLVEGGLDFL